MNLFNQIHEYETTIMLIRLSRQTTENIFMAKPAPHKYKQPVLNRFWSRVAPYGTLTCRCYNIEYISETNLKLQYHGISFFHYLFLCCEIVSNFAPSTTISLPCSVQNLKMILQMKCVMDGRGSRDLSSSL